VSAPLLELAEVTKVFPGSLALDRVDFHVGHAEIIGLIGENGAGKSTLMRILGGVTAPSSGTIRLAGREVSALTVPESIAAGIAFVHQELNLFDNLDVAANVMIGREQHFAGPLRLIDRSALRSRVAPILKRLGADFGPDADIATLSLAQRQLVEIAKALSLDARLLILDEPTSSLTLSETNRLLKVIAELRAGGVSVIFISHRLNEIERCADRVVVLRDGRVVGELARHAITPDAMIRLMIGRDLKSLYTPPASPARQEVMSLKGIRTHAHPDRPVDLSLHRGEILGLAGLVGSGRTELARAVFGIDSKVAGTIWLDGRETEVISPRDAIAAGIYLVPEDRKQSGLLLDVSVAENISLADLRRYSRLSLIDRRAELDNARRQKDRLDIRCRGVLDEVRSLSGGNQQKVVLARWLSMSPRVIIFDEPTRGVDVGAKSEIYGIMRSLSDGGAGVLMISSDMEEVIGVSDRIAVMHEGAISGFLERRHFSEANVLKLAVGATVH
jgi:ribose transport system ATP-binding protein